MTAYSRLKLRKTPNIGPHTCTTKVHNNKLQKYELEFRYTTKYHKPENIKLYKISKILLKIGSSLVGYNKFNK